jgi:hypothetical protein
MKVPERFRVKKGIFASDRSFDNNGCFLIPHQKIDGYSYWVQASDGSPEVPWQHVSVSLRTAKKLVHRCPTWEDMCWIKNQFWEPEEAVFQIHPPASQNVSLADFCLHLWKPLSFVFMLPPSIAVGPESAIKAPL